MIILSTIVRHNALSGKVVASVMTTSDGTTTKDITCYQAELKDADFAELTITQASLQVAREGAKLNRAYAEQIFGQTFKNYV